MSMVRALLLAMIAGSLVSCGRSSTPRPMPSGGPSTASASGGGPKEITYKDADGWVIHGDYYAVLGAKKAALLLHQRGGSASDWQPLSDDLQSAGIAVLAIDQRGAGRSIGKLNNNDAPWDTTPDIASGIAWLEEQGLSPKHIALVGASYGANNAAIYAASHLEVPAIVLLSPGVDYHGLRIPPGLSKYPGAILVVTSRDDQIADGGPRAVQQIGPKTSVQSYDGSAHGTSIFQDHSDSISAVAGFIRGKL